MEKVQIIFNGETHNIDEDGYTIKGCELKFEEETFVNIGIKDEDKYEVTIEYVLDMVYEEPEEVKSCVNCSYEDDCMIRDVGEVETCVAMYKAKEDKNR